MNMHKFFDDFESRPIRELDDVEPILHTMELEGGQWHIAAVHINNVWRVILIVEALDFHVAIPGVYATKEEAVACSRTLGVRLGGVSWAKEAQA